MHSLPQTASDSLPTPHGTFKRPRKPEDVAYQSLTVAAIVLLLGSLWVF
jgi:hypothetical protein